MSYIYEKIRFQTMDGKRVTLLFQILSEGPMFILAEEVDLEGTDKSYFDEKKNSYVSTNYLIDKSTVSKRVKYVMDKKYGELREKTYQDLQVGDVVTCRKDFLYDSAANKRTKRNSKVAFVKGKKYMIKATGIIEDDGVKWITMVNEQGDDHSMDNEEYPNDPDGDHYDFSTHFKVS